jgi:hypothetical protein
LMLERSEAFRMLRFTFCVALFSADLCVAKLQPPFLPLLEPVLLYAILHHVKGKVVPY